MTLAPQIAAFRRLESVLSCFASANDKPAWNGGGHSFEISRIGDNSTTLENAVDDFQNGRVENIGLQRVPDWQRQLSTTMGNWFYDVRDKDVDPDPHRISEFLSEQFGGIDCYDPDAFLPAVLSDIQCVIRPIDMYSVVFSPKRYYADSCEDFAFQGAGEIFYLSFSCTPPDADTGGLPL